MVDRAMNRFSFRHSHGQKTQVATAASMALPVMVNSRHQYSARAIIGKIISVGYHNGDR
jgi:hypothetical protein